MVRKRWIIAATVLLSAGMAHAQNPDSMSSFFEGRKVTVLLAMPGSQEGIDLYPQRTPPLDTRSYATRMKRYPVSLREGDTTLITKVKVKEKLIEFQLGGGGFGTAGDDQDTSVHFTPLPRSQREKDLEDAIKTEPNADRRDRLRSDLNYLRDQRQRTDERNRQAAEQTAEMKKSRVDDQRTHGGSRFNLRYDGHLPADLTPQDVMAALTQYINFSQAPQGSANLPTANPPPADLSGGIQKGMSIDQVRGILGQPTLANDEERDGIQLHKELYVKGQTSITATFANGVLIKTSMN